jgi:hypothetical protein
VPITLVIGSSGSQIPLHSQAAPFIDAGKVPNEREYTRSLPSLWRCQSSLWPRTSAQTSLLLFRAQVRFAGQVMINTACGLSTHSNGDLREFLEYPVIPHSDDSDSSTGASTALLIPVPLWVSFSEVRCTESPESTALATYERLRSTSSITIDFKNPSIENSASAADFADSTAGSGSFPLKRIASRQRLSS